MRIAILADIHGNLLALEAVLSDLAARGGADILVDLGDRVSGPLWPAETLRRLADLPMIAVRGNHDRLVAFGEPSSLGSTDAFTRTTLCPEQRARLGELPTIATVAPTIVAFHATPAHDDVYLLDRVENGRLVRDAHAAIRGRLGCAQSANVIFCAHSHRADLVRLASGTTLINPGSVGCPAYADSAGTPHVSEAGSPHARYAIVDVEAGSVRAVTFCVVSYDFEAAAQRADANGRSDWAYALRNGRVT